jgi:hypothetical protein
MKEQTMSETTTEAVIIHLTRDHWSTGGTYRLTVIFPGMDPIEAVTCTDLPVFGTRVAQFFEDMEGCVLDVANNMPAVCECGNPWDLCHPYA